MAHFQTASLFLSSLSVPPSFVIITPMKINLTTISILLSSNIIWSNLPVVMNFVFLKFKYINTFLIKNYEEKKIKSKIYKI